MRKQAGSKGMKEAAAARPYHHGDLQRALVEAAGRVLEREGPTALSLRAVAREAGVSPAAPYHHFKDKDDLINAVAKQGFDILAEVMRSASKDAETASERLVSMGVAYVVFARDHPALYHVMFDAKRKREFRANAPRDPDGAYARPWAAHQPATRRPIPRIWSWPPSPAGARPTAWRRCRPRGSSTS